MSSVNNVGGNTPVQRVITPPVQKQVPADAPSQVRVSDRVDLSGVSHLIKALKTNDIRTDKVASIKAQIADGSYETDDKLNSAIDKLIDDLGK